MPPIVQKFGTMKYRKNNREMIAPTTPVTIIMIFFSPMATLSATADV